MKRFAFVCVTLICVVTASARAEPPPIGINLTAVNYYATEYPFIDLFRTSQPLVSQRDGAAYGKGDPQEMREDGYPARLSPGHYMNTLMCVGNPRYRGGRYVCLYDGKGRISFGRDARATAQRPGRIDAQVTPDSGITLTIRETDPADPVRNIRFFPAEFEQTRARQPFDPVFLDTWRGVRVLRFMDWMRTNGSKVVEWSDRPIVGEQTQGTDRGVAPEHMIDLANTLGADPWFCMPHLASDDYVRRFAALVHQRLAAGRRVYIEYSNETWNGTFEQARHCRARGRELRLSDNDFQAQLRYHAHRAGEIFRIWEEVFGGRRRLVRVLAAQAANPWSSEQVLTWKDAYRNADALAIGAYFGHELGDPKRVAEVTSMPVENVLNGCSALLEKERRTLLKQGELARKFKLSLVGYEWGQHLVGHGGAQDDQKLTDLFIAANRHPLMKALYLEHMRNWQEAGGDLAVMFSSTYRPNKWGSWGVQEYQGQDVATAPKMQALREMMGPQK